MNETEEQRHARWSREREIDKVVIPLGLAYQSHQRGIVYWHAHAQDASRKGYEAGKVAEREACATICDHRYDWATLDGGYEAQACADAIRARSKTGTDGYGTATAG